VALDYTATYDPGGDGDILLIARIRKAIQDIDVGTTAPAPTIGRAQWSVLFLDQEILMSAADHADKVNQADMAAADLLEEIASNAALLAKHITLGDYSSDTRVTPRTIREHADYIRNRYAKALAAGADEAAESISDEIWTDFDFRRSVWAQNAP
jgi:hypothetical protein